MVNNRKKDQPVIDGIRAGGLQESNAISKLIQQNEGKIMSLVKKYNGSEMEAQDVLIEGITEVVFQIKNNKFRGESTLSTFLYRICRLIWFQKFRSKKVDHFSEALEDNTALSIQAQLEYSNNGEVLNNVLEQLGEACKQVLSLWSEGFNMTEIKDEMGYANSQISMNKKNRCLKKLRDLMNNSPQLLKTLNELRYGN